MGVLDKCCGNCKHFKYEDVEGRGLCVNFFSEQCCTHLCKGYEYMNGETNAWTEINPDNVDEIDAIDPNRVVIATMIEGIVFSSMRADSDITLKACSELGGYYYYVLPELRIE